MTVSSALARPMLAGIFIVGGFDAVRNPASKEHLARDVAPRIAAPLGLPTDPVKLVRINGAVQVAAGTLLAFGKLPRLSATALALSLVPTTWAGHRFWEETDKQKKKQQRTQFLKNTGLLGGLIFAARDTGGRPSLSWRARRAAKKASKAAAKMSHMVTHNVAQLAQEATHGATDVLHRVAS